jgi:probable addiction module antidote protein
MAKLKTSRWDSSKYIVSPEDEVEYLKAAMEEGDPSAITDAIGVIARARGMTEIAKETGLAREALYRALSEEGRPEFATVMKVLEALGLRLSATPISKPQTTRRLRPKNARRAAAERATKPSSRRRRAD